MKWISRSIIPAAVALAALVSFFPRSGPKIELEMREFKFTPQVLTVHVGDSVALVNEGDATHSFVCVSAEAPAQPGDAPAAKAPGCGVDPGDIQPGLTKVVKFVRAGEYDFYCGYHSTRGMVGRLVVLEPGEKAPPAPSAPPTASPAP